MHYLCNMMTKNLYTNIGLLMCKALTINALYHPPQFCNRYKKITFPYRESLWIGYHSALLLLAPGK